MGVYGCRNWLSGWTCGAFNYEAQKDSKSCGVHVIEVCYF